jgi:hypothetical protein
MGCEFMSILQEEQQKCIHSFSQETVILTLELKKSGIMILLKIHEELS